MKIGPLLRVTWRDAFRPTLSGWWNDDDLDEFIAERDFMVESVGYKVHEDDETLTLAQSVARNVSQICEVIRIPLGCIVKRERLHGPTVKTRVRAKVR